MTKGRGVSNPLKYTIGSSRPAHAGRPRLEAMTARDEEEAYRALQNIKRRARRERREHEEEEQRRKITLPKIRF